jgi:hypothetical protein
MGVAWSGTRAKKRPTRPPEAGVGDGSARRVPSPVCAGPQEVTEPGAHNSGPVQNSGLEGPHRRGGVIASTGAV